MSDKAWALIAPEETGKAAVFEPPVLAFEAPEPCPEPRRDYVRIAAWLFAVLFGPALVALATVIVILLT